MKKQIIVTSYQNNIEPIAFTIKGNTEKELILDMYIQYEDLMYTIGEEDEILNMLGEYSDKECIKKIQHNTFDEFIEHLKGYEYDKYTVNDI